MMSQERSACTVAIVEVLLMGNDKVKRLDWSRGRVVELLPGRDRKTCQVRIKIAKGSLLEPIQGIHPLEHFEL